MGIWSGGKTTKRDGTPGMPFDQAMRGLLGGGSTYADASVNTVEQGLSVAAVGNAVDLLASICSELPLFVYRGDDGSRTRVRTNALDDPSGDGQGLADFVYSGTVSWTLRGNLYGNVVEGDPASRLGQVILFHPDDVTANIDSEGKVTWRVNGREFPKAQLLHRRAYSVPGRLLGRSVIAQHADILGVNIAATRFGKQWFTDGAHPGGILSNELADLKDETVRQTAKDRFMAAVRGSREPVVLGRGWKWESIQVNPDDSQFLETQEYSAAEAARIFGPGVAEVLGYKSGGSLTYTNMVDRDLAVLKYAANKWLKRWERLLGQFLPGPQYVEFDREAFLETNIVQMWQARKTQLETGSRTVNELRAKDKLPPVEWGNEPFKFAPTEPEGDDSTDSDQRENQ